MLTSVTATSYSRWLAAMRIQRDGTFNRSRPDGSCRLCLVLRPSTSLREPQNWSMLRIQTIIHTELHYGELFRRGVAHAAHFGGTTLRYTVDRRGI